MISSRENPRLQQLLQGAFIEQRYGDGLRSEDNRLYLPKAIRVEQVKELLGRERCPRRVGDVLMHSGGMPQTFFGLQVDGSVLRELEGMLPVIMTRGTTEDRVAALRAGIDRYAAQQAEERQGVEFLETHPVIRELIQEHGVLVKPGKALQPSLLVLPGTHLMEAQQALADGLNIPVHIQPVQSPNPFCEGEGIEIRGHALNALVKQGVDAARVTRADDAEGMKALLGMTPEAKALVTAMGEQPQLQALLQDKGFFLQPDTRWGHSTPGAVAFAREEDVAAALADLQKVPGYEKAALGDAHDATGLMCPHINLEGCGKNAAMLLSGFAGKMQVRSIFGGTEETPKAAIRPIVVERLMRQAEQSQEPTRGFAEAERQRRESGGGFDLFR